jgi:16S rRNA C1402 N4-methylase RsmH
MTMKSAVNISHLFMSDSICTGDIVIDATAGNGHDTLFMAESVGKEGVVIAIDKQEGAIQSTKNLLLEHDIQHVNCMLGDHAEMDKFLQPFMQRVSCISFNLGYLPGSADRSIITNAQSTIKALNACLPLLNYRGSISVIAYRGHEHGLEEALAVEDWMRKLPTNEWHVTRTEPINQSASAPIVYFAEKKR